jgi:CDGSH-type Zn-finger protein
MLRSFAGVVPTDAKCLPIRAQAGFVATGEPAIFESAALAHRNEPLAIESKPDGPLHVTGNLEVITGTGKTAQKVTECSLCRCGQSKNRPYCDGSHRSLGHWNLSSVEPRKRATLPR